MSGVLINDYSNSDSNILAVQSTLDKTFFAKIDSITLTNFDNSTQPAIAAGSIVECNGALYSFSSEESISLTDPVTSSTVADGTVYVCLVPSTSTITAAFTATAPTWSDSKQGWYGTGWQANYRYVGGCYKDSTDYIGKFLYNRKNAIIHVEGYISANVTSYTAGDPFPFDTISANDGNCYNTTDYKFYCPVDGVYNVSAQIWKAHNAFGSLSPISIYKNGSLYRSYSGINASGDPLIANCSLGILCSAGDILWVAGGYDASVTYYYITGTPSPCSFNISMVNF